MLSRWLEALYLCKTCRKSVTSNEGSSFRGNKRTDLRVLTWSILCCRHALYGNFSGAATGITVWIQVRGFWPKNTHGQFFGAFLCVINDRVVFQIWSFLLYNLERKMYCSLYYIGLISYLIISGVDKLYTVSLTFGKTVYKMQLNKH